MLGHKIGTSCKTPSHYCVGAVWPSESLQCSWVTSPRPAFSWIPFSDSTSVWWPLCLNSHAGRVFPSHKTLFKCHPIKYVLYYCLSWSFLFLLPSPKHFSRLQPAYQCYLHHSPDHSCVSSLPAWLVNLYFLLHCQNHCYVNEPILTLFYCSSVSLHAEIC